MSGPVDEILASLRAGYRVAAAWIGAHRERIEVAAPSIAALLAIYLIGASTLSAAARYREETLRLAEVEASVEHWLERLQPPTPAESANWLQSEQAIREIGDQGADATTVARIVALRAEESGITGLNLRLLRGDSVSVPPAVQVGRWSIAAGSSAVAVDFAGDWSSVIGFLGSLPPQVEVREIEVRPTADFLVRARVVLLARAISSDSR
jgi:hypothetical protein